MGYIKSNILFCALRRHCFDKLAAMACKSIVVCTFLHPFSISVLGRVHRFCRVHRSHQPDAEGRNQPETQVVLQIVWPGRQRENRQGWVGDNIHGNVSYTSKAVKSYANWVNHLGNGQVFVGCTRPARILYHAPISTRKPTVCMTRACCKRLSLALVDFKTGWHHHARLNLFYFANHMHSK